MLEVHKGGFGALEVHNYSFGRVWSFGGAQVLYWTWLELWRCTSAHLEVFGALGGAQGLIEGVWRTLELVSAHYLVFGAQAHSL